MFICCLSGWGGSCVGGMLFCLFALLVSAGVIFTRRLSGRVGIVSFGVHVDAGSSKTG